MTVAVVILIVGAAITVSVLALVAAIGFLVKLDEPRYDGQARVTLILPLTGPAPKIERLTAALEGQSLKPRRLLIAVESQEDPAYARALGLARASPLPIEVVLAGEALRCAQKNFNLIAALAHVDDNDEIIVLLDADIVPPRWWLATLVAPLLDGVGDVVTGYRWPLVDRATLGAHLIAAIDRPIAILPRVPGWARMVWGGSVALPRSTLQRLDLDDALATSLTDDGVIGERAAALGLRIITRRSLLLPTPLQSSFSAAWRFGRRQYQILGLYRPQLHMLSLAAVSTRLLAWCILGLNIASPWAASTAMILVILALAAHGVRLAVAKHLALSDRAPVMLAQTILVMAQPVVDLAHWSMIVAGLAGGQVRWGHITYGVTAPDRISIVARRPWRP